MIRVGIADDHAIVRAGLRDCLSAHVDLRVAGEACNGEEALALARSGEIDVLLLDISMPGLNGVDALAAIKARLPELPVLILSGFPEAHYATTLLRQGASGYLGKDSDPDQIADAVRLAARGRRYVSPALAEQLADGLARGPDAGSAAPAHAALSERELQVFLRLAQGQTIGHMAETLHLSVKTVSTYRSRVLSKLGLATNSDLTYYALKNGLIQ
jgi:DNA-binding NarL/FixJ family response regulator